MKESPKVCQGGRGGNTSSREEGLIQFLAKVLGNGGIGERKRNEGLPGKLHEGQARQGGHREFDLSDSTKTNFLRMV